MTFPKKTQILILGASKKVHGSGGVELYRCPYILKEELCYISYMNIKNT